MDQTQNPDAPSSSLVRPNTTDPKATAPQSRFTKALRNPLFLVILTWAVMAFLLAFEVTGK